MSGFFIYLQFGLIRMAAPLYSPSARKGIGSCSPATNATHTFSITGRVNARLYLSMTADVKPAQNELIIISVRLFTRRFYV
jgi:hypothetical protein